jgi:hypothetical protein
VGRGIALAGALLGVVLGGNAMGQPAARADQLIGTWILVSHEASYPDGSKRLPYGPNPNGTAIFDPGGRFIISVMRSDRPKFAKNLPWLGSAEENKTAAEGTMTYFGTYSVNEAERTISIHIEASSFPNWNGADQTRGFAIAGDQLTLTVRALPTGGGAEVIWKRAK